MLARGAVPVLAPLRGSYCTRRGGIAPGARADGCGMGTPGRPAQVSMPVRGGAEARGLTDGAGVGVGAATGAADGAAAAAATGAGGGGAATTGSGSGATTLGISRTGAG